MKTLIFTLFFICQTALLTAQTATIKGTIKGHDNVPIENVTITFKDKGTTTDKYGNYLFIIEVPKSKKVTIVYSHVSYETYSKKIQVRKNGTSNFSPKLQLKNETIDEILLDTKKAKEEKERAKGIETIKTDEIVHIPTATDGISGVIKSIGAGVSESGGGESSTYNVRGGNYDENLVYVNGIEVYRPFLVRSGQQEGLSFVNANLTKNVAFSSGGFQAKYGDKLSSVLDITYRKPKKFAVGIDVSLLGASATVEGITKNKKLAAIVGARYRNNSLIVSSKDIESNYKPSFTDVQSYVSYEVSDKFSIDFLGNFGLNNYEFTPYSRVTNFGLVSNPKALIVNYEGKEIDKYLTLFGALKADYKLNDKFSLSLTTSSYNTQEEEYFDINAFYGIGDVNADFGSESFGNVEFSQSIGSQLDHARNDLDALINNVNLKATYQSVKDNLKDTFEFGIKFQHEDIIDRIIEWEVIDSAGFSVRPPDLVGSNNEQPYEPFTGPIVPFTNVNASNHIKIDRFSGFAQWSREMYVNEATVWMNLGIRGQTWLVSGTTGTDNIDQRMVFSPRAQFAFKPNWEKDMLFRLSGGYYHQPPFYKELRGKNGLVNPDVTAQQSIHFVAASDFNFKLWERPFKLVTEAYYKKMTDVNPFTIDNVQIRYAANNNAIAYAMGFDARISGEFVPGTESYFTLGLLKTEENIDNKGYINRPTDQRLKAAILFQDYLPMNKNFKMYLNMVYNTGVPGGSPAFADPYIYQSRLKDYFRSDIGVHYMLVDTNKKPKSKWLQKLKSLSVGIELYNMFDVKNTITNTWVRDVSSKRSYAIPNYLTGRVLNGKVRLQF